MMGQIQPIKIFSLWIIPFFLLASPPIEIPVDLYNEYTLGGIIPVRSWYIDNSYPSEKPLVFEFDEIDSLIEKAKKREESYYGATDRYLYAILDQFKPFLSGKKIAVIGSTTPWYESVLLSYGAHPVTIEYNKIISKDPRVEVMTVEEYWANPQNFNAIVSISSIEHDGLGRYGDPIDPNGDLNTMKKLISMLNPGGILILSIPVGEDAIYWNAHRVYGRVRLPLLFNGWELVDSFGFFESDLSQSGYSGHQPVFVLTPEIAE